VIVFQRFHVLLVDALDAFTHPFRKFGDKKIGQQRDIVFSRPKGRNPDGEDVEPEKQVGPEGDVCLLCLLPGFPAVPQYFTHSPL
jgi:hypothetical protein